MYSTVPTGSLVTLGGHLRVVLHSDDATASVSANPRRYWRTVPSLRRAASIPLQTCIYDWPTLRDSTKICGLEFLKFMPFEILVNKFYKFSIIEAHRINVEIRISLN